MDFNAFILDWTMNDYPLLKHELTDAGFSFKNEGEHLRLVVPFERLQEATTLFQRHLNVPFNYVDIQFPEEGKTVIVFQHNDFTISNSEENEQARRWAIAQGLPPAQADWSISY